MPEFNEDFDVDMGQKMMDVYKNQVGCFACRKPDAAMRCSRCQMGWYCNRECQKQHWKSGHKETCKVWCDNIKPGEEGGHVAIPIVMRSCGYISEESFANAMKARSELFLKEMKQSSSSDARTLGCQIGVIEMFGKIRLNMAATFVTDSFERITVNHIWLRDVDDNRVESGDELSRGSGKVSNDTKRMVRHALCEVGSKAKEYEVDIFSFTYGRGLMFISDDEEFQKSVEDAAGRKIVWTPDIRYTMQDAMSSAMGAAFGGL